MKPRPSSLVSPPHHHIPLLDYIHRILPVDNPSEGRVAPVEVGLRAVRDEVLDALGVYA